MNETIAAIIILSMAAYMAFIVFGEGELRIKNQAVAHGYAKWVLVNGGPDSEFKWNDELDKGGG